MKIVTPHVKVYFHFPAEILPNQGPKQYATFFDKGLECFLEKVGRTCYKSEENITEESADKFVKMLDNRGHRAMLEHCYASVKFVCDRGVTHELVRHRIASYAQESSRYCDYTKEKFNSQISVIEPLGMSDDEEKIWRQAMETADQAYHDLIKAGAPPQRARHVLPISLKTEIWTSTNLREWQHIFNLRCAKNAHPHIRKVMLDALDIFRKVVPVMFESLWEKYGEHK